MPHRRKNKTIAGYHLLMILSAIDGKIPVQEDRIIREYLFQEFPFHISLDNETDILSALHPDDWHPHFLHCMDDFYNDATPEERNEFLKFAVYLVKADEHISPEENFYLQTLFDAWDFNRE